MPPPAPRVSCPACGHAVSRVMHVEYRGEGPAVEMWRRRQCDACHARFTTQGTERVVSGPTIYLRVDILPPTTST